MSNPDLDGASFGRPELRPKSSRRERYARKDEREAILVQRVDRAKARVAHLETALQQLRVHATNPAWTTPDGALALVNEIEAALAEDEK